jgi:hypothetical protein
MSKVLPIGAQPAAAPAATVGQEMDAVVAGLHARVTALEVKAGTVETEIKTTAQKAWAWIASNWHHALTAVATSAGALKYLGILKL